MEISGFVEVDKIVGNKILKMCKNYLTPDMNSQNCNLYFIKDINDSFTDWDMGGFCVRSIIPICDYLIDLDNRVVLQPISNFTDKELILKIRDECPELTFDNDGYQYISQDVKDKYKNEIKIVENILRKYIKGFVEFNNFKPRKDGNICIRCQYKWSDIFTGVGYFNINDIFCQNNKN